ncbi:MAG: zf-HC2 domain-containing protein [Bacteroidota bacterium]
MNCNRYKEQVSLFMDNELGAGEQTQLFDHLANCLDCHLFLDSIMKFKSMKHEEEIAFPDEIDQNLFEEIKHREYVYRLGKHGLEVRAPFWQRRVALSLPTLTAITAAIVILVSTLFVNVLSLGEQPKTPPTQTTQDLKKSNRQDVIVYGVPGVTVYSSTGKPVKTGL